MKLAFRPLTPDRWADLEALFGPTRGAISGCWCMWFRLTRGEWTEQGRDGRKRAFQRLVEQGPPPGLLAYDGTRAVGWCAIAPREATPRLATSRVAKPIDDRPANEQLTWAITCFYVDKDYRGRGVMAALVKAATAHAKNAGARLVEAYPMEKVGSDAWGGAFVGVASCFTGAGFKEAARRTPNRPLMRKTL